MRSTQTIEVDVAVVGAGPAGAAAAMRLKRGGHLSVLAVERASCVGGVPSRYTTDTVATFLRLPRPFPLDGATYARLLADDVKRSGLDVHLETTVVSLDLEERVLHLLSPERGCYEVRAKAILLACGAREKTAFEHRWLYGRRPARVYNSMQVLDLVRHGLTPHAANAALIGTQPAAFAMAAKLGRDGITCTMIDHESRWRTPLPMRLYFGRWSKLRREVITSDVMIHGSRAAEGIGKVSSERDVTAARYVLLPGDLVPNTELLMAAGAPVERPSWRVSPDTRNGLASRGVFLCGNVCGGEHGAHWAAASGSRTAGAVAQYLRGASR